MTGFILWTHTEIGVSHSQYRKKKKQKQKKNTKNLGGAFGQKMHVNGPLGSKLASRKSLAVGVACMAIYGPAPGFKGRTFELFVLNRRFF